MTGTVGRAKADEDIPGLPGLKFRPCKPFPYLVFYMVLPKKIEILRVLRARRDIPASPPDEVPAQAGALIEPE